MKTKIADLEKSEKGIVQSIIKASCILSCIAKGSNGVAVISKDLALSKGTTHRLLKSLIKGGMVIQDPLSEKYFLGPNVHQWLANLTVAHQILGSCSLAEMQRLMTITGETVLLHIRMGLQRVCIEEVESLQNIKYINGIGFPAPLHTGAAGKVLLSELPDQDIDLLLVRANLFPVTGKTITDKKKMLSEIQQVRRLGYATSFGERVEGSGCVSVPVKNYSVPVALSVLGPDNRFNARAIQRFLADVKESAERISEKLAELVIGVDQTGKQGGEGNEKQRG